MPASGAAVPIAPAAQEFQPSRAVAVAAPRSAGVRAALPVVSPPAEVRSYNVEPEATLEVASSPVAERRSNHVSFHDPKTLRVWTQAGVSSSSLNWNIGVPPTIDILSELTWRNVRSKRLEVGGEYRCIGSWCDGVMVLASLYADQSFSGKNLDSDWLASGRVDEFSRSLNDIHGSALTGGSVALGYELAYDRSNIGVSLIPSLGYAYDTQQMRMNNGYQVLSTTGVPLGPFDGLDSTYDAQWDGPFAGLEARIRLLESHEFRFGASVHESTYEAAADWNLRGDFQHPVSYEHFARGFGRKFEVGYSYWFRPDWEFRLNARYVNQKVGPGDDIVYFSDGSVGTARLNEVKHKSHSYTAGIGYSF